jgi:hypothetical protein
MRAAPASCCLTGAASWLQPRCPLPAVTASSARTIRTPRPPPPANNAHVWNVRVLRGVCLCGSTRRTPQRQARVSVWWTAVREALPSHHDAACAPPCHGTSHERGRSNMATATTYTTSLSRARINTRPYCGSGARPHSQQLFPSQPQHTGKDGARVGGQER